MKWVFATSLLEGICSRCYEFWASRWLEYDVFLLAYYANAWYYGDLVDRMVALYGLFISRFDGSDYDFRLIYGHEIMLAIWSNSWGLRINARTIGIGYFESWGHDFRLVGGCKISQWRFSIELRRSLDISGFAIHYLFINEDRVAILSSRS